MTSCQRFEEEGLLLLEQGKVLGEHYQNCAECMANMAKHEKLKAAIAALESDASPVAGWKDSVREAAHHSTQAPRSWQRPALLTGIAASVALALGVVVFQQEVTAPFAMSVQVERDSVIYRGTSARPGDKLTIIGSGVTHDYAELRFYKDGKQLVMSCTDQPPCEREGLTLRATTSLTAFGTYRAVVITSELPPPELEGTLDADVLSAREHGASALISDPIEVR